MEANSDEPRRVIDQTQSSDSDDPNTQWVSPEIAAAEAGEQVEMGKQVEDVSSPEPVVRLAEPGPGTQVR